jgi:hypothetical protein
MKAARLPKGFAAFYLPAITACLNLNDVSPIGDRENDSIESLPAWA